MKRVLLAISLLVAALLLVWLFWPSARRPDDAQLAKLAEAPFESLTVQDQVAVLLYRLRVPADTSKQDAKENLLGLDLFPDPGNGETPATQLLKIGQPAVPQLIEALEDDRETPYEYTLRMIPFSILQTKAQVRDCALEVLRRLSGRELVERVVRQSDLQEKEWSSAAKREASTWWREVEAKGEKKNLQDSTAAGNANSPAQAQLLAAKYPDVALGSMIQGAQLSTDPWVCTQLVGIAAQLKGDGVIPFLREELVNTNRNTRVVAAAGLLAHGHTEGVRAMVKEWDEARPVNDEEHDYHLLIDFLASCGKVEAIRALGKRLADRPARIKIRIVFSLRDDEWGEGYSTTSLKYKKEIDWPFAKDRDLPAVRDAGDDVLASLLEDNDLFPGTFAYNGTTNPRVGDLAAEALTKRWKTPELFKITEPEFVKNDQRGKVKEMWQSRRTKHGQQKPEGPTSPMF